MATYEINLKDAPKTQVYSGKSSMMNGIANLSVNNESTDRILTNYLDVLYKANFYRGRIVKSLARYGEMITDEAILQRLADIDLYQPIYKHERVHAKNNFDTEKFNYDMEEIVSDLGILYQLLHEIGVKRYEEIKAIIEAHLKEIEDEAIRYASRIEMEVNSSYLGDSVFYSGGPFEWTKEKGRYYVELCELEITEGSMLALIASSSNTEASKIKVGISIGDDIEYIRPFNIQRDVFFTPGERTVEEYTFLLDKDYVPNRSFPMPIPDFTPDATKHYTAFAGRDCFLAQTETKETARKMDSANAMHVEAGEEVSFYVRHASYVRFELSEDIKEKSFKNNEISSPNSLQKVFMRNDSEFAFQVFTDGVIFASKKICRIENNELFFPSGTDAKDFLVTETSKGKVINSRLFLVVDSGSDQVPDITGISIKELLEEDLTDDLL